MTITQAIRSGDRVTIVDRFGVRHTGRAVMPCISGGWVLNMGGRHGTPGIANDDNTVKVRPTARPRTSAAARLALAARATFTAAQCCTAQEADGSCAECYTPVGGLR